MSFMWNLRLVLDCFYDDFDYATKRAEMQKKKSIAAKSSLWNKTYLGTTEQQYKPLSDENDFQL